MRRLKWMMLTLILVLPLMLMAYNRKVEKKASDSGERKMTASFTSRSTIGEIINHPAFKGFGRFLFPLQGETYDRDMPLSQVGKLLPYHENIVPDSAATLLNRMLLRVEAGEHLFYDIYTDTQKQADCTKKETGIFFFRGKPDAPFAVVCPGGGFSYVGSIHESLPHADYLSGKGYNVFAIQYRTGGAQVACEDLAAALSFIFRHAQTLKISTDGYSLWGGSAGARMAAYLGSYGASAYGGDDLLRPSVVVMQYTGHSDYTRNDPPTFVVIGENDAIASPAVMRERMDTLKSLGVDVEFHLYPDLGHGFGMGYGTTAQGWIDFALRFWEKHLQHRSNK